MLFLYYAFVKFDTLLYICGISICFTDSVTQYNISVLLISAFYKSIIEIYIVTYRGFYSRWKFIYVPKSQHTTAKYTQPFSKHTSDVYTQRCPTQDSFYRTYSGNLPTRTHTLAVRKSPDTRDSLSVSQY
jgi:hypothetical protein